MASGLADARRQLVFRGEEAIYRTTKRNSDHRTMRLVPQCSLVMQVGHEAHLDEHARYVGSLQDGEARMAGRIVKQLGTLPEARHRVLLHLAEPNSVSWRIGLARISAPEVRSAAFSRAASLPVCASEAVAANV